jgi:crotonobetainyl-CoA:carnitine CoA-transferase CaiB-like acyl-CoA transferase
MSVDSGDRWLELQGLKVIEFGGTLSNRLLVKLLSDQGADISCYNWKSQEDSVASANWSDGRVVRDHDMSSKRSREDLWQLIEESDVFITSFDQEAMLEIGLDYKSLSSRIPSLLYCAIGAFPAEAERVENQNAEWIVAAELGLDRITTPDDPRVEPLPLASVYAAIQAAIYLAGGLTLRDRSGAGMFMELSLFGATITTLSVNLVEISDPTVVSLQGRYRLPSADRYMCADGRAVQVQATTPEVLTAMLRSMGHDELLEEAVLGLTGLPSAESVRDWYDRFAEIFRQRTSWEWEEIAAAEGAAVTVCRTRAEWVEESHAYETGILKKVQGSTKPDLGPAVRLYPLERSVVDTVTAGSGKSTNVQSETHLPLAGKRVLDLSIIFAGPTCGRLLAELGADVIKIDAPYRSAPPYLSPMAWLDVQRSKRSLLVDLRTEEGKEVLWRLIDESDAILQNYRAGKLDKLGFGYEEVVARKPDIVYISMNAFDFDGAMSRRPGWEPNAQALTGMQMSRIKGGGMPPRVPVPANDFASGFLCAYGAILALRAAERTGKGQRVLGSLTRTASFIQTSELAWATGDTTDRPSWLDSEIRFVECEDGWLAVQINPASGIDDADFVTSRGLTRISAMEFFRGRSLKAVIAREPHDLRNAGWVREAGLLKTWDNPNWGEMTNVFARGTTTGMEHRYGWPAPDPGQDSASVLRTFGYSDEQITKLSETGVIAGPIPLFGRAPGS